MYRNQARRWHVGLMLASIIFCATTWYVLDVQPSQAQSESPDVIGLATVPTALTVPATNTPKPTRTPKPTKTATSLPTQTATASPTSTATATATATGIATLPTVPSTVTETPTGMATVPTTAPTATETPTGIATVPTVPPTATETPTGIATVPTVPPTATIVPTAPPVTPTPVTGLIFMSSSKSGRVDGGKFSDEDIITYNSDTDAWSMIVDGSDVGLHRLDLTDFYLMDDGSILMSFNKAFTLSSLGRVDDSDIIRFTPTKLGNETQGTFEWFFDGSDVGLASSGEDIDAIAFDPDGNLVISTKGSFHVDDLKGKDEDLFVLNDGEFGEETSGTWEIYFDGSTVELTRGNEDIDGAWINPATGNLYLTTKGNFKAVSPINSIEGDGNDIFIALPSTSGDTIVYAFQLFFDGNSARLTKRIDGIAIGAPANLIPLLPPGLTTMDEEDGDLEAQYSVLEDEDIDGAAIDEEVDEYDQEAEEVEESILPRVIFLPLINK